VGKRATASVLLAGLIAGCGKPGTTTESGTPSGTDQKQPDGPNVKNVTPTQQFSGAVSDPQLEKLAPASLIVTTKADFEKMWEKWWEFGKTPEVDFKTSFVVVRTLSPAKAKPVEGTEGISIFLMKVSPDGSAQILHGPSLETSGPDDKPKKWEPTKGFYWGMAVFPREGVKTVDGKELPAP
jgi:hypothetical protein